MFILEFSCEYLEKLLDGLVSDAGLCLSLTHHVVQILLKVFSVFDQMHGHVIICGTLPQPRKDTPEKTRVLLL